MGAEQPQRESMFPYPPDGTVVYALFNGESRFHSGPVRTVDGHQVVDDPEKGQRRIDEASHWYVPGVDDVRKEDL